MESEAFLVVQQGEPYENGEVLPLRSEKIRIGRSWRDQTADIVFKDSRISRNHAEIYHDGDHFVLCDLPSSMNGVAVNGMPLTKGMPVVLKDNDEIDLGQCAVILRFYYEVEDGRTERASNVSDEQKQDQLADDTEAMVGVDKKRREVIVNGKELDPRIIGLEFDLAQLLYENRGAAVHHDDIVEWVWRETPNRDTITRQDVNTLVHRLRKSLGEYGSYIKNIPGFGYRLD